MADANLAIKIAAQNMASGELDRVKQHLSSLGSAADDAESHTSKLGGAVGAVGQTLAVGLVGAVGAVVVGLGAAVKSASDFEQTLSGVKAVSGATADEMDSMRGLALQLGKDTAFSASQAAAGMEELVKGGLSVPDIMNGAASSMLNLAAAGGVSLPEAATISANAMSQFSLHGSDMAHVSDLIAGAANASALDVSDFGFALQASGAVAATVGFNFDDLSQAIAVMGKAGITGSDAGTSLKQMMINLIPQTSSAADEMQHLGLFSINSAAGVDKLTETLKGAGDRGMKALQAAGKDGVITLDELYAAANKLDPALVANAGSVNEWAMGQGIANNAFFDGNHHIRSMAEVSQILQDSMKNLGTEEQITAMHTMFGTDAIRAAAIVSKAGSEGFNEMSDAMGKVTAASVGAERMNNLKGDMEQLRGSVETAAISLGTALLPSLRDLAQAATGAVNAAIPLIEKWGPAVAQALSATGTIISGFVTSANNAFDVLNFDVTAVLTGDMPAAFDTLIEDVKILEMNLLKWVGDMVGPLVQKFLEWAAAFIDWVAPQIPPLLREVGHLLDKLNVWLLDVGLPAIAENLAKWAAAFVEWVAPRIGPLLLELGKLLLELDIWLLTTALPRIIDHLIQWGGAFLGWVAKDVLPNLPGALGAILESLGTWLSGTAIPQAEAYMGQLAHNMVTAIGTGLGNLGSTIGDALKTAFNSIKIDAGPFHLSASGFSIDGPKLPSVDLNGIFTGGGGQRGGDFGAGAGTIPQAVGGLLTKAGLSAAAIAAFCGPLAAEAIARGLGKAVDIGTLTTKALQAGWTTAEMGGTGNFQSLLSKLGIASGMGGEAAAASAAAAGIPIAISTNGHYFEATGYANGRFHVGNSGLVYGGGSTDLTWGQMGTLGHGAEVAIIPRVQRGGLFGDTFGDVNAAQSGNPVTINVSGNTILGDEFSVVRQLAQLLKPELDRLVSGPA